MKNNKQELSKCLSKACAESKTLVVTKGLNRNSFNIHCKRKHRLKIDSINGQIISIKKPRCSKCEMEFSRDQTSKDHEDKCIIDLKKGNSQIQNTQNYHQIIILTGSRRRRKSQALLDEHSTSLDQTGNVLHSKEIRTPNVKGKQLL